jgi:hypothetical protein
MDLSLAIEKEGPSAVIFLIVEPKSFLHISIVQAEADPTMRIPFG